MTGPGLDEFDNTSVCREYTLPRHRPDSCLKGPNGVNTRIRPAMEVVVTNVRAMYGVQIKIQSRQNEETDSWVIISRGIDKYVTECTIDHVDAIRDDIPVLSSVKSVALVKYQGAPSSTSKENAHGPMGRRKLFHIPMVEHTEEGLLPGGENDDECISF